MVIREVDRGEASGAPGLPNTREGEEAGGSLRVIGLPVCKTDELQA